LKQDKLYFVKLGVCPILLS